MAQLRKILLVDDDDDLREALSEQLVMTEDFDVFEADSGATAMQKTKEGLYDLIILDVGLPDTDGRELCRLMRKQGVKAPVLMLTGHDSDADTILGLDAGANDYVTKPFSPRKLVARVRAVLKLVSAPPQGSALTFGELSLDTAAHHCTVGGVAVALTSTEFSLLSALVRYPSQLRSRAQLVDAIWGARSQISDRTLDSHLRNVRGKLAAARYFIIWELPAKDSALAQFASMDPLCRDLDPAYL